ncbi:hypothetical protein Q8F55_003270 [Vanrija albida]|uniref:Protein CPL1-like domain-containing protein n=1 Tax=Vanrija albida TaxID=181172 RepID=A0ABR3Q4B2_9TREE
MAGCYSAATPQSTVQNGPFTFLGCSSTCRTQSNRYFFYNPDTQGCVCALTTWSNPSALLQGSLTAGCSPGNQSPPGCQSCPFNSWQYWDSETSFVTGLSTCYNQPNINIGLGSYNVISNPGQCFVQCAFSVYAYMYANIVFNQWNCFCSNDNLVNSGAPSVGCQQGSLFAAASGFQRRKRIDPATNTYCPGTLSACRASDSSEGYECLDTRSELESCGGCVNGYYDNSTHASGFNCDLLSTHSQQYSCVDGTCQPY